MQEIRNLLLSRERSTKETGHDMGRLVRVVVVIVRLLFAVVLIAAAAVLLSLFFFFFFFFFNLLITAAVAAIVVLLFIVRSRPGLMVFFPATLDFIVIFFSLPGCHLLLSFLLLVFLLHLL